MERPTLADSGFLMVLAISSAAAVASPLGGLMALWRKPTTLFMSVALGFASGILFATIGFEMMPRALELGSLLLAVGGFASGFLLVYGFDLFVHRGQVAGTASEQRPQTERYHRRHRPYGTGATVLAGGTSAEELIEGLSIGVGIVIQPGLGILIALTISIDNISEALSIGQLIRDEPQSDLRRQTWRILGWTSLIGGALFGSAMAGWFFLRGLSEPVLGVLLAIGAGGMFYLTITDLVPEAEYRHYQQSSALAMGTGFLLIFVLSQYL